MKQNWSAEQEEALVIAAQAGDIRAFDLLSRRYRSAVILIAKRFAKCSDLAEDIVQDSFLLAFKQLPKLREPAAFGNWLAAIVRHRANRKRSSNNENHLILDEILLKNAPSMAVAPDSLVASLSLLDCLSPELRDIAYLYYFEEWTVAEIGDFLKLTATTVKWRLHTTRQLLQKHLQVDLNENP